MSWAGRVCLPSTDMIDALAVDTRVLPDEFAAIMTTALFWSNWNLAMREHHGALEPWESDDESH